MCLVDGLSRKLKFDPPRPSSMKFVFGSPSPKTCSPEHGETALFLVVPPEQLGCGPRVVSWGTCAQFVSVTGMCGRDRRTGLPDSVCSAR